MKLRSLLDQIRLDLRALDPDQQRRVKSAIGKAPRYLARVSIESLKLETIFALGRCLGHRPSEYLSYLLNEPANTWIQPGPVGLFHRLSRLARKSSHSNQLQAVLKWGYGVTVKKGSGPSIDLEARLNNLGMDLSAGDSLQYAETLLSLLARNSSGQLSEKSIRSLVGSMSLVIEILGQEGAPYEACQALDLAFYLESLIQDLRLRQRLFEQGGHICLQLRQPQHGVWCLQEASLLALLVSNYDKCRDLQRRTIRIADDVGIDLAGKSTTTDPAESGIRDLDLLLSIMATDRRASPISAAELDSRLGAQKAFAMAVKRRAPMSVGRWDRFSRALGISPWIQIRRMDLLQSPVLPMGQFMRRLKVGDHKHKAFAWQTRILSWCDRVDISSTAPRRSAFAGDAWTLPPEQGFEAIIQALARLASGILPRDLHPSDATILINGLLRLVHVLRLKSQLNDAADILDAALTLEDDLHPQSTTLPAALRTASALALYLGHPRKSKNLLHRARLLDAIQWDPRGLVLTHFWQGTIAQLTGAYEAAMTIHYACLEPARQYGGVPVWLVYSNMSWTALRTGDIIRAGELLDSCIREGVHESADYLWNRGEFLSRSGAESEALRHLEQAQRRIIDEGRKTDSVLIQIEKCRHFLRYQRLDPARDQAKLLISSMRHLDGNPIGKAALMEFARSIFCGNWNLDSIQTVMRRIQIPYLK